MFGFGKGKATITLDKYQFSPGETINGTLTFDLKKPVEASGVAVTLLGDSKVTEMRNGQRYTSTRRVFDFSLPLDGEKTYPAGTSSYSFSLAVPAGVGAQPNMQTNNAVLNTIVGAAQMFGGMGTSMVEWQVEGRLKAKGLDVVKRVQVNISG